MVIRKQITLVTLSDATKFTFVSDLRTFVWNREPSQNSVTLPCFTPHLLGR